MRANREEGGHRETYLALEELDKADRDLPHPWRHQLAGPDRAELGVGALIRIPKSTKKTTRMRKNEGKTVR